MEDFRAKKGKVVEANREKIKDKLFAGVEDEFNRLAEIFTESINQHPAINAEFLNIIKTFTFIPTPIKRLIDAIGIIKYEDKVYFPVVAATPEVDGGITPRLESTVLSNLRETGVALADARTPRNVRARYRENCAIPGAI
ncbi:hypothetical protein K1T71_011825 [Dendrolimus kikuchii]|uniref:Uncharacterized protein n=1 Tax=Dendrolimus kikuchii TaxID=765133 RepID=A0ACC1CML6_9NEOP|nr:hypothetical protein K1T71_011825 [Dendrolimus kikuchii]